MRCWDVREDSWRARRDWSPGAIGLARADRTLTPNRCPPEQGSPSPAPHRPTTVSKLIDFIWYAQNLKILLSQQLAELKTPFPCRFIHVKFFKKSSLQCPGFYERSSHHVRDRTCQRRKNIRIVTRQKKAVQLIKPFFSFFLEFGKRNEKSFGLLKKDI